jgi:hypothetical protein
MSKLAYATVSIAIAVTPAIAESNRFDPNKATLGNCIAAMLEAQNHDNEWQAPFSAKECKNILARLIDQRFGGLGLFDGMAEGLSVTAGKIKSKEGDIVKVIVQVENQGQEEIDSVGVDCTVFDDQHEPLGVGRTTFSHLKPNEKAYGEAGVDIGGGTGATASCRQAF